MQAETSPVDCQEKLKDLYKLAKKRGSNGLVFWQALKVLEALSEDKQIIFWQLYKDNLLAMKDASMAMEQALYEYEIKASFYKRQSWRKVKRAERV